MKRTLLTAATMPPATMLYDASCGLCTEIASRMARRVSEDRLRVVPLQRAASDPRVAPLVAGRDLTSTLHFVTADGVVLTGARAVIAAARALPRWGALARLADNRAGHALLEPAYRRVAANRHRIGPVFGLPAACASPVARPALPSGFEPTDRSVGR